MSTEQPTRIAIPQGPFSPTWESLENYRIPKWYEDAKFGIFIHWGVYSVPAFGNEWYPRNMYRKEAPDFEHHVKTYGSQSQFGYKDFIPMFKAEKFDANAWADLFKKSGAKFVVPVAEHHDGFAMYDTKLSRWNSVNMGPKRDIIGELSKAIRDRDMIFGLSSHRIEHWWFMNGGTEFDSDVKDPNFADLYGPAKPEHTPPDHPFMTDWLNRCTELVDQYRPQIFWFDWWIEQPAMKHYLRQFAAYYYNRADQWDKGVAINFKFDAYVPGTAVYDIERGQMADIRKDFWQADTAVAKNSWGHIAGMQYKTAESLIGDLVDIVSKNGALLLNIGPRADGSIPQEDQDILLAIGKWLSINGEAIYGTRPWKVYGEGPTEIPEGHFTDTKRSDFTSQDIRFTRRGGDTLYAICLGKTTSENLLVRSLGSDLRVLTTGITKVRLLDGDRELKFSRLPEGLQISLPQETLDKHGVAVKIKLAGGGQA